METPDCPDNPCGSFLKRALAPYLIPSTWSPLSSPEIANLRLLWFCYSSLSVQISFQCLFAFLFHRAPLRICLRWRWQSGWRHPKSIFGSGHVGSRRAWGPHAHSVRTQASCCASECLVETGWEKGIRALLIVTPRPGELANDLAHGV